MKTLGTVQLGFLAIFLVYWLSLAVSITPRADPNNLTLTESDVLFWALGMCRLIMSPFKVVTVTTYFHYFNTYLDFGKI